MDNGKEHFELKNRVLVELSKRGAMAWNNVTGVFYTRSGQLVRVGVPGAPDILGVYQGRPMAFEIKTGSGNLSTEQKQWRDIFRQHGGEFHEIRNIDDLDGIC